MTTVVSHFYRKRNHLLKITQLATKLPIYPPPFRRFSSLRHFHKHLVCNCVPRWGSYETRDSFGYPKPSEVKCKKTLNSVQLIGYVGWPVKLTHLKSGKVMGSTRLAVSNHATHVTWFNLRIWGELAHVAHQHLQKGNRIYVFGHLQSDILRTEDGKQQTLLKVVVHQLNFVKSSPFPLPVYDESCSSMEEGASFGQSGSYPKPSEVKWKKALCNAVKFIGIVGFPVKLTQLKSGKVVGSTQLGVETFATDKSWISLTFLGEWAHIAHQHLQKGNLIYVSGRLLSDTVRSEEGEQRTYYKVLVQQLNFVEECSSSPLSVCDKSYISMAPDGEFSNSATRTKLSTQEWWDNRWTKAEFVWQAFFANPTEWWDNRNNKNKPRSPDFHHKDSSEALWIEDRYNPPWVKSQLEILDSRMQSHRKQDEPGVSGVI